MFLNKSTLNNESAKDCIVIQSHRASMNLITQMIKIC